MVFEVSFTIIIVCSSSILPSLILLERAVVGCFQCYAYIGEKEGSQLDVSFVGEVTLMYHQCGSSESEPYLYLYVDYPTDHLDTYDVIVFLPSYTYGT